ncbi:MAG: hypothetical protein EOO05_17210 [Chitinophagaceae bacterium]|nr:MAG: hypothetical protein EOO05_17210 [Chitinophagaceae bacterium]
MNKNNNIRSILAGFLLLVFCLGVTPKQILHNLLTNHRHIPANNHQESTIDIQPSKYVCDIHDQVAESPFVETEQPVFAPAFIYLAAVASEFHEAPFYITVEHADLRGPPALA